MAFSFNGFLMPLITIHLFLLANGLFQDGNIFFGLILYMICEFYLESSCCCFVEFGLLLGHLSFYYRIGFFRWHKRACVSFKLIESFLTIIRFFQKLLLQILKIYEFWIELLLFLFSFSFLNRFRYSLSSISHSLSICSLFNFLRQSTVVRW